MIPRYTLPEMGALWSEESKFRHWLEVELAVCRAMAEMKQIPMTAWRTIKKKADFDINRINEVEAETNHDVIAFLTSVSEYVGPEAKYIHFGMTSSDMLDTALSMQMTKAAKLIDKRIGTALTKIKRLALKYKMTPMIGRTGWRADGSGFVLPPRKRESARFPARSGISPISIPKSRPGSAAIWD